MIIAQSDQNQWYLLHSKTKCWVIIAITFFTDEVTDHLLHIQKNEVNIADHLLLIQKNEANIIGELLIFWKIRGGGGSKKQCKFLFFYC
jgi:hypothetical protein